MKVSFLSFASPHHLTEENNSTRVTTGENGFSIGENKENPFFQGYVCIIIVCKRHIMVLCICVSSAWVLKSIIFHAFVLWVENLWLSVGSFEEFKSFAKFSVSGGVLEVLSETGKGKGLMGGNPSTSPSNYHLNLKLRQAISTINNACRLSPKTFLQNA
jgi:hypothetical protein